MRRRLLLSVAGAAVVVAGLLVTPLLLRHAAFFRVRQVELIGVRYLVPDDVLDVLALEPNQSIFDNVDPLEDRLSRMGGVVQARVRRRLPGTLRVEVSERFPMALTPGPRGMVVLDAWAKPLPYDPAASGVDLPVVARPDTLLVGALAAVRFASRDLYDEVEWVEANPEGGVRLDLGERRILMQDVPTMGDVDAVLAVREQIGNAYDELDARYNGWVVVRRRET